MPAILQEEFRSLVFKFAKEASKEEVSYILLFGSVARGDTDRRSDVDLLVVFDTDKDDFEDLEARNEVSELALDLEKEYDKNVQVIFTNRNFHGLDEYFIKEVMNGGILLYARSPRIEVKGLELEPYTLILYNLKKFSKKEKMKLKRLLYGHTTRKKVKGKTYKSEKIGLVQQLDGKHLGAGVITVPQTKAQSLEKELEKLKLDYRRIDLWLTEDDLIKIRI
ncbi:MAG: nucleotidyltransferase domain-containing protein [Planctomycetes bacterium]|nr:nucleotidyltransferase domain-containing protein [Planctomycetota bacterium]